MADNSLVESDQESSPRITDCDACLNTGGIHQDSILGQQLTGFCPHCVYGIAAWALSIIWNWRPYEAPACPTMLIIQEHRLIAPGLHRAVRWAWENVA